MGGHGFRPPNQSESYESHVIPAGNPENATSLHSSTRPRDEFSEERPRYDVRPSAPEIYPGETMDRLLGTIRRVLTMPETFPLHERTQIVLKGIEEKASLSASYAALLRDLDRAAHDGSKNAHGFHTVLLGLGFQEKSTNRHTRLEPPEGVFGIGSVTLPQSSSDRRALQNAKTQIKKILGLTDLD
jgi:hypothetical protein